MKSILQQFLLKSKITLSFAIAFILAFTVMSCSKKVEVKGNFAGGSPLERIEFIEASGVATLPLVNIGVDSKGSFSGSFEAPKNGMYIMAYAGKTAMVYLKGGQTFNISGQAANFPNQFTITGDAKNNNDFLIDVQKFIQDYASKINIGELVTKKEADFLKSIEKINADLEKGIDTAAKKTSADSDAITFKKDELRASILQLMNQYEMNHPQATQNPAYKPSQQFKDAVAKLDTNKDRMLKTQPIYRNYLLGTLSPDFQNFVSTHKKADTELSSEMFAQFLDTKKEMSQLTKDYLLAFVMTSSDIGAGQTPENAAKLAKIIKEKIKDSEIRKDLERIQFVIDGPKIGEAFPASKTILADGKTFKIGEAKAKPTLVMFYASWNPYISEATVPVMKEVANFYKSKVDFAFVNFDDTKDQFVKTSSAMLKGISGTNVYAENGLKSDLAKELGIYGFKLPTFVIVGKDGKFASKFYHNLGDPELVQEMDKISGLKAPTVEQEAHLQNEFIPQTQPENAAQTK